MQISKSTLDFLKDLGINNNREWFEANRTRYEAARSQFEEFVQACIKEISSFDPLLKGLEARSCIFRLNRDTRFSHDKSPYKTNFGAFIVRGGKKSSDRFAGYYLHLEPGSCMVAGGAYMPPSPWLNAIREKIAENPSDLTRIINSKTFKDAFGEITGEKLKTAPKGFPKDHPAVELLKHKSFVVVREMTDREATGKDFFNLFVNLSKAMKPFNDYLSDCKY